MNPLFISSFLVQLRNLANTPNITQVPFAALKVSRIREDILNISKDVEIEEPQVSSQLLRAKEILFYTNIVGQTMLNPFALGEIIFGLDYLEAKQQKKQNNPLQENEIWSYIHPLILKSSKQLFEDGHYANAAEDAFIEINDRVKNLFKKQTPNATRIPDGDAAMTTVFSTNNPLIEFSDRSTETGSNKQKGYMQMLAGAMSALRNPKAHSNTETLSGGESYRRLATASMLMYAIDDAVKYSGIIE